MKMKLTILTLALALLSGTSVFAEEAKSKEENFAERKTQMAKDLNEEKAGLDKVITCVNSAQKHEDMKKCNEIRHANIQKIRERSIEKRKERLQNEIKQLDEKGKKLKEGDDKKVD